MATTNFVSGTIIAAPWLNDVDEAVYITVPANTADITSKAPLASPIFTGTPVAPTAGGGTNTTQLATTAFVTTADNLKANLAGATFTGLVLNYKTNTALADDAAILTAAQLIGGEATITPTVARLRQLPLATNIITAMTNSSDNSSFEFSLVNLAAFDVTLTVNTGVTIVGRAVINNGSATWRVRRLTSTTVQLTRVEGAAGTLPTIQIFTTSGIWTRPDGVSWVRVRLVGGGGGGGGCIIDVSAGGGGGGGYSERIFAPSASETITIGAGGTGGAVTGADGTAGGTSSFGAVLSATGGAGGLGKASNVPSYGVLGGLGSGGQINVGGNDGGAGTQLNSALTGMGGGSVLGGGGLNTYGGAGGVGRQYGGGGGGGGGDTAGVGGAGASGVVIVEEFY